MAAELLDSWALASVPPVLRTWLSVNICGTLAVLLVGESSSWSRRPMTSATFCAAAGRSSAPNREHGRIRGEPGSSAETSLHIARVGLGGYPQFHAGPEAGSLDLSLARASGRSAGTVVAHPPLSVPSWASSILVDSPRGASWNGVRCRPCPSPAGLPRR